MGNLNNSPILRFPEFSGEWVTKKLGEITVINPSNKKLPHEFIYIDLESVANGELLKENLIQKNGSPSRAQRLLEKGDILFQMVRPYQMNNLHFNRTGNYVASTGYAQIRTKQNEGFLFQHLHFQKFVDKVIEKCTGTSYPSINSTDLSNIEICLPEVNEQTKIANFLTAVDDKLNQLKKKKSLLDEYKKGVIQKIFSQELRFKDENGEEFPEWEEKKLGEVTYKVDKKNKNREVLPVYSISNKNGFVPQSEQFEGVDSNERGYDISLYKIIENNTFAYNPARINVGSIGYSGIIGRVIVSSLYVCFKTGQCVKDLFFNYYLNTNHFKDSVISKGEGGVRIYLFYENFSEITINLPTLHEQTKISNFLSAIDDKINQCGVQIEKMEGWKKGLLQKMFV